MRIAFRQGVVAALTVVAGIGVFAGLRREARAEREALASDIDRLLDRHRTALTADLRRIAAEEVRRGVDHAFSPQAIRQGAAGSVRAAAQMIDAFLAPDTPPGAADGDARPFPPARAPSVDGGHARSEPDFLDAVIRRP